MNRSVYLQNNLAREKYSLGIGVPLVRLLNSQAAFLLIDRKDKEIQYRDAPYCLLQEQRRLAHQEPHSAWTACEQFLGGTTRHGNPRLSEHYERN